MVIKGKLDLSKLKKKDLVIVANFLLDYTFKGKFRESFIQKITKIKGVRFVEEKR